MGYKIILDENIVNEIFGNLTPFNLKNELKKVKKEYRIDRIYIEEFCADEIGLQYNPPRRCRIIQKDNVEIIKFRMSDLKNNRGSSYGFRIILLKDNINRLAIVLSITHKIDKKDLTQQEKNQLKVLLESYVNSL